MLYYLGKRNTRRKKFKNPLMTQRKMKLLSLFYQQIYQNKFKKKIQNVMYIFKPTLPLF